MEERARAWKQPRFALPRQVSTGEPKMEGFKKHFSQFEFIPSKIVFDLINQTD
jgi:hypothetical protein